MPVFLFEDESVKLGKRQLTLPQDLVDHLYQQQQLYSDKAYTTTKGYKRLNSLLNKDYNNPSDKKDRQHNSNKTISFSDAKRIEHDIKHMPQTKDNVEYSMIGGDMMRDWVHNALGSLRNSVRQVQAVPPVPKLADELPKVPDINKETKVSGIEVTLESFANQIKKIF